MDYASKHTTLHKSKFDTYKVITPSNVHLVDNNIVQAIRMGSIVIESSLKYQINHIRIKHMLYIPKLHINFPFEDEGFKYPLNHGK